MTTHRVLILGAGAAGTAAARTLAGHDDLDVTLVSGGDEEPYTRMLIKGVAIGCTPPEVIRLPLPNVRFLSDTADSVDTETHRVRLTSATPLDYDSLIVATGSSPRHLPATVTGAAEAHTSGAVTTLHSLRDALYIRQALGTGQKKHVLLYGGGVTAAETASLLIDAGHTVTLIARNALPGESVFGRDLAQSVAQLHRDRMDTRFGCTITSVSHNKGTITVHLDDGTSHTGDLLVVALGTVPLPPAPWADSITVSDRQRTTVDGVWAAGGVTAHDDALGSWRIDHWEDSAAQGTHAALDLLHSRDLAHDPGPYLPRSPFMAMIHGHILSGVGLTATGSSRPLAGEELVLVHEHTDGTPAGVSGMDALLTVNQWRDQLHAALLDSQP